MGLNPTIVWPVSVRAGAREVTRALPAEGTVQKIVIDPDAWYPTWIARTTAGSGRSAEVRAAVVDAMNRRRKWRQ